MNFVLSMAWRESRAAWGKFLFFLLSIAIGVASLTGVKGFSVSLTSAMSDQARTLLAADFSASLQTKPSQAQNAALHKVATRYESTPIVEVSTIASSPQSSAATLVEVKAVEPGRYPLYGRLVTDGPDPAAVLRSGQALVAQELLQRLGLKAGDQLKLGNVTVPIGAVLTKEPDRAVVGFALGPRVMVSQDTLGKADLLGTGSRAKYTWLYKLPPGESLDAAQRTFRSDPPLRRMRFTDYRNAQPTVQRILERMANFLSLVALLSLLVGGLGVANTMRVFLQQKLQNIAVMKCLGASSRQVFAVYFLQALALGVLGSLLGVGLGYSVQLLLPGLIGPLLQLDTPVQIAYGPVVQGLVVGLLVAVAFSVVPLLAVRRVKPVLLMRRNFTPAPKAGSLRRAAGAVVWVVLGALVFGGAASWLAGSWRYGFSFIAGLGATLAVLGIVATVVLAVVRWLPRPRRLTLRHGLQNLYRPGAQTQAVVMALGTGIAVTLTVYLIQSSLLQEIVAVMPPSTPNMVFADVQRDQRDEFQQALRAIPGVVYAPDPMPIVGQARVVSVDGQPVTNIPGVRAAQTSFTMTASDHQPPGSDLVSGRWWAPADYQNQPVPLISVEERSAKALGIGVGSTVSFDVGGKTLQVKAFNLRRGERLGPEGAFQMVLSPGALDRYGATFLLTAKVQDGQEGIVTKWVGEHYPGVTVVSIGDVMRTVQDILNRIGLVIRFIASFSIVAGLIIMSGAIAATKFRRIREAAMFKVLGATRGTVARIFAIEYGVVGLAAGLVGALSASLAAGALLNLILQTNYLIRPWIIVVGMIGTALLTIVTGFVSSIDILNRKPLVVLREE